MMKKIAAVLTIALSTAAVGCAASPDEAGIDNQEQAAELDAGGSDAVVSQIEARLADVALDIANGEADDCEIEFVRAIAGDRALDVQGCEKSIIADIIEIGDPSDDKHFVSVNRNEFTPSEDKWVTLSIDLDNGVETTPEQNDMLDFAEELRAGAAPTTGGYGEIGVAPEQTLEQGGQGIGNTPGKELRRVESDRLENRTDHMNHQ